MDDIIFEKDYRETESAEYDKWCDEVFDRAVNCGMLKAYSEAMDKIPKIIVPEDKKNYEYLLERCDAFVKQHRGYIKGIVDYHRWHAEINMFLPFAEFDDSEDLAFLKEIAEKSQTVCFSPEEEGGIRVHIFINYFEELMSAEHKSYIEYDAIMQDKKLSELLGIPELSDEEVKAECVVTDEGNEILEIKNIAVNPENQGKGYGKALIDFLASKYADEYSVLQVGTGDSPLTVPFYEKCGFVRSHKIPKFFTDNYDHPIYEGGVQLIDMVYLQRHI
ncbi:hypothetical protein K440107A6_13130 [Lawsonibacter asaccharolyticus]